MYQAMGYELLETRVVEPKPGWRFQSHLIYMDIERVVAGERAWPRRAGHGRCRDVRGLRARDAVRAGRLNGELAVNAPSPGANTSEV